MTRGQLVGRPTNLKVKEPLPIARVAAAHIAHRFAPRPQPSLPTPASRAEPAARSFPNLGVSPRVLLLALAGLALLPNLTVAAFLWWPSPGQSGAQQAAPLVKVASLANPPLRETAKAEPATVAPVLTVPAQLEASASATIDLTIALDGTDGVPARSSIAISGLPDGAKLSNGRPYGANGWNLKSDEIGDLQLSLPDSGQGEKTLAVELVAPHGEVLAKAETLLKITATPEADPEPLPGQVVAALEEPAGPAAPAAATPGLEPIPLEASEESAAVAKAAEAKPELVAVVQPEDTAGPAAEARPQSTAKPMALASPDAAPAAEGEETVTPSMYVNLRERPTSSASVLGVVPKGAKLAVMDRSRGWVQVTHPTTSQVGWIYDGNHWAPRRARRAAAPAASEESFWTRLGRTLAGSSTAEPEQN
jgi:hypothetical protein